MYKGIITDIQRYSTHEGPGIRTTVFFKGCQLRCTWCHNPETIIPEKELMFYPEQCLGCRECAAVCPRSLHSFQENDMGVPEHQIGFELCDACGRCVDVCWAAALVISGREADTGEVMAEIEEDRPFYGKKGGVTFSGGEPLLQIEFLSALLKECRRKGIHTAVETNLIFPAETVERVIPDADLFIADLKIMDQENHVKYTGEDNFLLFENIRRIDKAGKPIILRTPLLPGVNDDEKTAEEAARFMKELENLRYYEVLPYHPLGLSKTEALGKNGVPFSIPNPEQVERYMSVFRRWGIRVYKGGKV